MIARARNLDEAALAATPLDVAERVGRFARLRAATVAAVATVALAITVWTLVFGSMALQRHAALGSSAEDLGFTDQVIWNFLQGQWMRTSIYLGASWNTELDVLALRRPDSLLAFHVEPMLVFLAPLYALGGGAEQLLILQAVALALGAIPAYRLGMAITSARSVGVAAALAWLLSPVTHWTALADFHTTAIAASLLLFGVERLLAGQPVTAMLVLVVALSAREDVSIPVAALGVAMALRGQWRVGGAIAGLGIAWAAWTLLGIMPSYSGATTPFVVRYGALFGGPEALLGALTQPVVLEYVVTLLLSGGWLAIFSPLLAAPAAPILALNVFSSSPWMASGKAHYSVLLLPFLIAGAVGGVGLLQRQTRRFLGEPRARLCTRACAGALLAGSLASYLAFSPGPLSLQAAPATVTEHARRATEVARAIPRDARVSATASLVPHLTHRSHVYVFPAVLDAEYVLLDIVASPAPTSVGDVFLRARQMVTAEGWTVARVANGLLVLQRPGSQQESSQSELDAAWLTALSSDLTAFARPALGSGAHPAAEQTFLDGALDLLHAELLPNPTGQIEPDGRRGILRTNWRANQPLPQWAGPRFTFEMTDGSVQESPEVAALWWYPADQWRVGETVQIDVPNVPLRRLAGWSVAVQQQETRRVSLGELTLEVTPDPWQLRLLGPGGVRIWEESVEQTLGYELPDGRWRRARRLAGFEPTAEGARLIVATDDPGGATFGLEIASIGPRAARLTVTAPEGARAVGGGLVARADERYVGLGERFTGVNQRGRVVEVWADDRVLAGHGESTYAPIPLLYSSAGYGVLLEGFEPSSFDLAASNPSRWSWQQTAPAASLVLTYGPSLSDLVKRNAEVTGLPPLPPMWAFGVIKTATGGQAHVLTEARRMREMQVPVTAIYAYDAVDHGANIGWPYVNFGGRTAGPYPDHAGFTGALHALGYKALNYFKADFHLDRPGWEVPDGRGYLVKRPDGTRYTHDRFPVTWLDFTNPAAVEWWAGLWRRGIAELGYDGGMLDVGEILPADAVMADGTTGHQSHNRYPLLYAQYAWQHASSLRPDGDFLLFARSGASGSQKYQSLQWSGDPTMSWEAPNGLQSLIPAALSFGLSGFPNWFTEVAGYLQVGLSPAEERELWFRWLQVGTWTVTLRDQYGDHPNNPIDFWLDEETRSAFRDAARIHNSLVPYLYTYAAEAASSGMPVMRFLALEAPDDPRAWEEEQSYLLGKDLLVAPVVQPGATSRTVYLPRGDWVDFWTDQPYRGGQEVTVPAPLSGGRAPVFIRAGAVIPLAADFDTLAPSSTPGVRTFRGDLIVRVAPGGTGPAQFGLYDGTRLEWNGSSLSVTDNAVPRTITLRAPGKPDATARIEGASGAIQVP